MIFSMFLKFVKSIAKNKRSSLWTLYNDVRTTISSIIITDLLKVGVDAKEIFCNEEEAKGDEVDGLIGHICPG